jgi:DNA replication protein DnaC
METSQHKTTEPGLQRMEVSNVVPLLQTVDADAGRAAIDAEIARVQTETAQQFKMRRADDLLKKAAIPPRFADRRLENFVPHAQGPANALKIATDYADGFEDVLKTGRSLILCGGVGAGKTHLAVGIAHRVIAMGRIAVFTSVLGAIRSVKETYSKGSQITEAQAIDNLTKPDLLILDEVGVQFGSDTEKMILFEIINGRYEKLRPTIVISNLAKEPLTEYLGERVVDRLREGGGRMVIFDWPSYRRIAS